MPTREEFLSTSLTAVDHAAKGQDCTICLSDLTDPVRLPCGHVFDRDCIRQWLEQRGRQTCPLDNMKLFELSREEDPRPDADRHQRAIDALRRSGLTVHPCETFGASGYTLSDLQRATARAVHVFGDVDPPLNDPGLALISPQQHGAHFIAMGNMIPAWTAAGGQTYAFRHLAEWRLVLSHLWTLLKAHEGKTYDALLLPAKLRQDVHTSLKDTYKDINGMAIFEGSLTEYSLSDDFDLFLQHLVQRFWTAQRAAEANQAVRRTENIHKKSRKEARCCIM